MKEGKEDEAMALNGLIANILARVSVMLHPVMPKTTTQIANSLGFTIDKDHYSAYIKEDKILDEFVIEKIPPLFPRIEEQLLVEEKASEVKAETPKEEKTEGVALITIDKFFETELKIGTIIEAEEVPKSKKLLLLKVDLDEETPRQIVAGIKEWYAPEELVGTQACVVANLKPAKLMGMKSEGMLLAAKDENGLSLLRPEAPKKSGTKVS
jgi:methionyl-tRNA synthetase